MPPHQPDHLAARYERIAQQLTALYANTADPVARMATAVALLHHKQPHFFWTGFYRLLGGDLVAGPYQGPLACAVLKRGRGVCWACATAGEPLLVPDVHAFPGHIACDERSQSEVVVPVLEAGLVVAVLDVDADRRDAFSAVDVAGLSRIAGMIYHSE